MLRRLPRTCVACGTQTLSFIQTADTFRFVSSRLLVHLPGYVSSDDVIAVWP